LPDRFIGNGKYLTARDAAQPNLMDFFDFTNEPWATIAHSRWIVLSPSCSVAVRSEP
jgi:hypothetical protein